MFYQYQHLIPSKSSISLEKDRGDVVKLGHALGGAPRLHAFGSGAERGEAHHVAHITIAIAIHISETCRADVHITSG